MSELSQKIQKVLSSGKISREEEQQINRLLWSTPLTKPTFEALRRLEHELATGHLLME